MNEIWKDIDGYEGLYQVSSYGNVRSLDRFINHPSGSQRLIKGQLLKPETTKFGYLQVSLSKCDLKHKRFKVHRLVANAFIENPLGLPQINHKDENKQNNNFENLEFCDAFYNQRYGTCSDRKRLHLTNHPKKSSPVEQLDENLNSIKIYPSAKEAQRQTGISQGSINRSCRLGYQAGGYKWRYLNK